MPSEQTVKQVIQELDAMREKAIYQEENLELAGAWDDFDEKLADSYQTLRDAALAGERLALMVERAGIEVSSGEMYQGIKKALSAYRSVVEKVKE